MADSAQRLLLQRSDAEFFLKFADQRRFNGFPRFALAPREFPEPPLMGFGRTQGNQDLPGRILNHSYGDMHDWWHWQFPVSVGAQLR
jgi:hypothetical protein